MSLFTDATLLLSLTANAGLGIAVAYLVERRRQPGPKPDKPRAANRNRQVSVPAHPLPMPVVYQEVTRLPVLDGDVTEVRDKTRLDLLKQHTERGWRARRGES